MPEPRLEFLLEVGFEEMPAPWLPGLTEQLRQRFEEAAQRERLLPERVEAFSTPRRLVLRADLLARQPDREQAVWGPSLRIARTAAGDWTPAALGFARKQGVSVEELGEGVKDPSKPEERSLVCAKKTEGRNALAILPAVIAGAVRSLAFPKRMSWDAWLDDGRGAFPFGRPIRWTLALLGGEVVPFAIYALVDGSKGPALVESGDRSHGHRFLPRGAGGSSLQVRSFDDLRDSLCKHFVLLDPQEREHAIRKGLARVIGRELHDDHGLIPEWRDLVEHPTVVAGRIPNEFASLPRDVLRIVLVHHQKYIPVELAAGTMGFAAVINSDAASAAGIVRGMERVVVARLRDAAFFFEEDRKRPLAERVADLAGVAFHRGLGSYRDKTERLVRLVDAMGAAMGLLTKPEHEAARQAAGLAKADLTTLMVKEFTELQGVMGGIYLSAEGTQWESVARAVRWHYHPVSVEEDSPPARELAGFDATVFAAVSLADKLDTLAGYFGLGLVPTGSSDPYGLRRAAQGVIRVLLDFWKADAAERRPDLNELVRAALEGYGTKLQEGDKARRDLLWFFLDRLQYVLTQRGFPQDEVDAVMNAEDEHVPAVFEPGAQPIRALRDVHDCWVRLRALHRVRQEDRETFADLAVAFKRAKNILSQAHPGRVDPSVFQSQAEHELHQTVERLQAMNGGYESRLRMLATLRGPVDRFFDDVLVMAEDPDVRASRLGLLSGALSLFYQIADISRLT